MRKNISRKQMLASLAIWIVLSAAIWFAPVEWFLGIATTLAVLSLLFWGLVYIKSKRDKEFEGKIEKLLNTDFYEARFETYDRMIPGGILLILTTMQVLIASEVFSDEMSQEISSLIVVGPVEIGVYTLLITLIAGWILGPTLQYFAERIFKEIRSEISTGSGEE